MWRPNIDSDVLMHSRGPWKKHKYIKVVDGQYIYPEQVAQNRGYDQTSRVRQQKAEKLRQERNAEGRSAASKQINAKKNLRTENINAGNLARARQKAKNARLREERNAEGKSAVNRQLRNAEGRLSARKQIEAGRRNELNNRNLEAARNKAARKASAKRIAEENARRSKAKARAGVYRGAVNKASEDSKRLSDFSRKLSKNTMYREFAKEKMYAKSGDNEKARKARKNKETAARVYNKGLMNERVSVNNGQSNGSWKMDDPRTRNKAKGKLPARLDVAAKQAGNAISREAYRTGYKARKAASSAAKSISSAAREAWNTASSYRDKFADFESFYKWYKKNVRK